MKYQMRSPLRKTNLKSTGGRNVRLFLFFLLLVIVFDPAKEAIQGWSDKNSDQQQEQEQFLPADGNDWPTGKHSQQHYNNYSKQT